MKKLLISLLVCGIHVSTYAQTTPGEPCCNIIARDIKKNLVVARDNTTGRLTTFKTDNLDINGIKKGDPVSIDLQTKKITAISGAVRNYPAIQPDRAQPVGILIALQIDNAETISGIGTPGPNGAAPINDIKTKINYGEPCCSIINIQPDPAEPCCSIVSFKNSTSGVSSQFKAPKNISNNLKTSDAVYVAPDPAEPINDFAIVQTNANGQMASYGYPATSAGTGEKTNAKWVVNKVNAKSGTGKLFVTLPENTAWDMTIFPAGSDKVLSNTMLQYSFSLLPGSYDLEINHIKITSVPVEKGNTTRLKTGVLHITNPTSWTLYDEAKKIVLINSSSAGKRGLPIGKYKLTIMGQDASIEIKDGETVEM
ncbi:MAG TPA: hypothetical protein VK489_15470 [Ferruginibacter sp.]|nr:hypothetical protein [Ferruginibacter sp.]